MGVIYRPNRNPDLTARPPRRSVRSIARGLSEALVFRDNRNLVGSNSYSLAGDAHINGLSQLVTDGSGDYLDFGVRSIHGGDLTIIAKLRPTGSIGATPMIVGADSSSDGKRDFQFRFNGGKVQAISFVGGSVGSATGSTTHSTGVPVTLGYSHSSTLSSGNIRVYYDGRLDGTGTLAGALDTDTPATIIGARAINTSYALADAIAAEFEYIYVWLRALTDAEHRLIAADPYQVVRPAAPAIYFVAAAPSSTIAPIAYHHFHHNLR